MKYEIKEWVVLLRCIAQCRHGNDESLKGMLVKQEKVGMCLNDRGSVGMLLAILLINTY